MRRFDFASGTSQRCYSLPNYFYSAIGLRSTVSRVIPFLRSRPPEQKPKLPEGVRVYAISDIHGCAHLLEPMLRVIDADLAHRRPRHAIEVFMGDYIDRGPDIRLTQYSDRAQPAK